MFEGTDGCRNITDRSFQTDQFCELRLKLVGVYFCLVPCSRICTRQLFERLVISTNGRDKCVPTFSCYIRYEILTTGKNPPWTNSIHSDSRCHYCEQMQPQLSISLAEIVIKMEMSLAPEAQNIFIFSIKE